MSRTVIAGPPGTGKTHTLIHKHLHNELIVNKTDSKKICYITFSNAAANEARERIQKEYPTFEFDWICTMHSMGTKLLNIDTSSQLLKDKNWNAFKNKYGHTDMHFETIERENGFHEYKNQYMKIIEYSRCTKTSLQDAAIKLDIHPSYLRRFERGTLVLRPHEVERMSSLYKTDLTTADGGPPHQVVY